MREVINLIEDFVTRYFDKIFLGMILSGLVTLAASATEAISTWAMNQASTVIGAIVMLTTGKVIASSRNGNGNGNGNGHDPTKPPTI